MDDDLCVICARIDIETPAVNDDLCTECASEQRQSLYDSGSPLYNEIYGK